MDSISDVIGNARAGRANAQWIKVAGRWGRRYPAFAGIGFHVIVRGSGWLLTPAGPSTALKPGDVVLLPFGSEHGISHFPCTLGELPVAVNEMEPVSTGPVEFEFICGAYKLHRGSLHQYLRELPEVVTASPDYEQNPELRILTDLLASDLAKDESGSGATRPALLDLIFVHAIRQWRDQNQTANWPATDDPAIAVALRLIHEDPRRPWTVQELADRAGTSRTTFARRFRAQVGQPPMAYLTSWRLSHGARLLRETGEPLRVIARQVGYSTEFAFSNAFRREFGLPPSHFRNAAAAGAVGSSSR